MNFSGMTYPTELFFFPETEWFALSDFRGEVGNERLQFSRQTAPKGYHFGLDTDTYPSILTFSTQAFHLDPSFRFEYEFETPPYGPGTKTYEPAGYYVEYTLRSGRRWSDTVRALTVDFQTGSTACSSMVVLAGGIQGKCVGEHLWRASYTNTSLDSDVRLLLPN